MTLQLNSDNKVSSHQWEADGGASDAIAQKMVKIDFSWYVPYFTPNVPRQKSMLEQHVSRAVTDLR